MVPRVLTFIHITDHCPHTIMVSAMLSVRMFSACSNWTSSSSTTICLQRTAEQFLRANLSRSSMPHSSMLLPKTRCMQSQEILTSSTQQQRLNYGQTDRHCQQQPQSRKSELRIFYRLMVLLFAIIAVNISVRFNVVNTQSEAS